MYCPGPGLYNIQTAKAPAFQRPAKPPVAERWWSGKLTSGHYGFSDQAGPIPFCFSSAADAAVLLLFACAAGRMQLSPSVRAWLPWVSRRQLCKVLQILLLFWMYCTVLWRCFILLYNLYDMSCDMNKCDSETLTVMCVCLCVFWLQSFRFLVLLQVVVVVVVGGADATGFLIDNLHTAQFSILSVCAHIWHRCLLPFNQFPFRLARLCDPHVEVEDKHQLAQDFLSACPCCLDSGYSQRLKAYMEASRLYKQIKNYRLQTICDPDFSFFSIANCCEPVPIHWTHTQMHEIDGDFIGPQSSCNGSASKWGFAFRGSNLRLVAALVTKGCLGVISHEVKVLAMRKVTTQR